MKKHSLVFIILICIFLSLSYSQQKTEWQGKIENEDGAKVVKNPGKPLYGEVTFNLEADLSIGREEDENYFFFRVSRIAVDKQGNIYVVDGGNTRIQVYDNEGQYLRTIGRKGQGPGEFQSPQSVFFNEENGEIYVPDFRSIEVFSSIADYLRTIPLESYNRSYCVSSHGVIIAEKDKAVFDKNNKAAQRKYFASLRFINSQDGSETPIASCPDQPSKFHFQKGKRCR